MPSKKFFLFIVWCKECRPNLINFRMCIHCIFLKFNIACFLASIEFVLTTHHLSHCMGKPTICIRQNKGTVQLRSNCEADQHLCFRYTDSTLPLLKFQASSLLLCLYSQVCVRPVRKPHCWLSRKTPHLLHYSVMSGWWSTSTSKKVVSSTSGFRGLLTDQSHMS